MANRLFLSSCLVSAEYRHSKVAEAHFSFSDGSGDSGSEGASGDDSGDNKDMNKSSDDIPRSDEPDPKRQRTN